MTRRITLKAGTTVYQPGFEMRLLRNIRATVVGWHFGLIIVHYAHDNYYVSPSEL